MSICVVVNSDGTLSQGIPSVNCPYVLVTPDEASSYTTGTQVMQQLNQTFEYYFGFDAELFGYMHGWLIASMVVGYGVGKTVSLLQS